MSSPLFRPHGGAVLGSLALHAAVIGAAWVAGRAVVVEEAEPTEPAPISFELIEEQSPAIDGNREQSTAIESDREQSTAIDGNREQSMAIDGNREQSTAIDGNREQSKLIAAPQALNKIAPSYPRAARRQHREGAVTVEFEVDSAGRVVSATVVGSSGHRDLDAAALAAARQASFAPATVDGIPMSTTLRLTFEFRLK